MAESFHNVLPGALDSDLEHEIRALEDNEKQPVEPPELMAAPALPEIEKHEDSSTESTPEALKDEIDEKASLHDAAKRGQQDLVVRLLDGQANVDTKDEQGYTSLHLAVMALHHGVVKVLLERKANLEITDHQGQTALHLAADKLKEKAPAKAGEESQLGQSYSNFVSMTAMVAKGRFSIAKGTKTRTSVQHGLDGVAHLDVVGLLLDHKAEVDAADSFGRTASYIAAKNEDSEVLALLLEHGANVRLKDHEGLSSVDVALQGASFDLPAVLAEHDIWSRAILMKLLRSEGFRAADLLENWPEDAMVVSKSAKVFALERATLRDPLRAVIAAECKLEDSIFTVKEEFVNLSKQNLVFAQEVQATLKVLPGFTAEDSCEADLLECLVDLGNRDLFRTSAVEAVISSAWQQLRIFTALDILLGLITVIALCYASHDMRHGDKRLTPLLVAGAVHLKLTVEELLRVFTGALRFAKDGRPIIATLMDFDNLVDYAYLFAGWMAIIRQILFVEYGLEKPFMSLYCAFAWLRALWTLRGESWMGPRLLPIFFALKDTAAFFMVTAICVMAATHAYYNFQVEDYPSPFYSAFLAVVLLGIFGDFNLIDFEGQRETLAFNEEVQGWQPVDLEPSPDYFYMHALFYLTGMGITVLLMNLLIGVLGQNFDTYQAQSSMLYLRARARMLLAVQRRPWTLQCLRRKECKQHLSVADRMVLRAGICLCFPLLPVLRNYFLAIVNALERILKEYHGMAVILSLSALLFFPLSLACLLLYLCGSVFFNPEGMSYCLAVSLGLCGFEPEDVGNDEPRRIWLLLRPEGQSDESQSLRAEFKLQLKSLKEMQRSQQEMQTRQQDMDLKLDAIAKMQLSGASTH